MHIKQSGSQSAICLERRAQFSELRTYRRRDSIFYIWLRCVFLAKCAAAKAGTARAENEKRRAGPGFAEYE